MAKTQHKKNPIDFKLAVFHELMKGQSQVEIALNFGIFRQLVNVWNCLYRIQTHVNNKFRQGRPRKITAT